MADVIIAEDQTQKISLIVRPKNGVGGLFLGNQKAAADLQLLKSYGIRSVITVAADIQNKYPPSIRHMQIDIEDQPLACISEHFDTTYNFIVKNIEQGNVFVHCRMGISRSASIVIGYLMRKYKCSYDKAYKKVKQRRSMINPNQGFVLQLRQHQKKIMHKAEKSGK